MRQKMIVLLTLFVLPLFAQEAAKPAAALADELLSEIARWSARSSGHAQEDDMTLIVVDCQGQS